MPGTNGVDRVGGCETLGPEAVDGGALGFGVSVGADSGPEEGAGAGIVETGRRPAQPVSNSAAIQPGTSQPKNGVTRAELRSTT